MIDRCCKSLADCETIQRAFGSGVPGRHDRYSLNASDVRGPILAEATYMVVDASYGSGTGGDAWAETEWQRIHFCPFCGAAL